MHKVLFWGDLTAKHNKIKETELVCILRIVVLAHKTRKYILCPEYGQLSKGTIQVESVQLFVMSFWAVYTRSTTHHLRCGGMFLLGL